ncbi:MAG TPA: hypothetical protein VGG11_07745 [Xanthobacteraceae bacterium]
MAHRAAFVHLVRRGAWLFGAMLFIASLLRRGDASPGNKREGGNTREQSGSLFSHF